MANRLMVGLDSTKDFKMILAEDVDPAAKQPLKVYGSTTGELDTSHGGRISYALDCFVRSTLLNQSVQARVLVHDLVEMGEGTQIELTGNVSVSVYAGQRGLSVTFVADTFRPMSGQPLKAAQHSIPLPEVK
jgi:hypothetical protein